MSNTFSELAATSLISALGAHATSDRFLVSTTPGVDLTDLFRAVLARAEGVRAFRTGPAARPEELRILQLDDGIVVVPYLVQEPTPRELRENRGSQGFASALRDHYDMAARADERMMLVVFDPRPNETLTTTMNRSLAETALSLELLLRHALRPPEGSSQALHRVCSELTQRSAELVPSLNPEIVGRAAQGVAELSLLTRAEEVGESLHHLPWCLADPRLFEHASSAFRSRLAEARKQRARLVKWAVDPSTDFDLEARGAFSASTAQKLAEARAGLQIRWDRFTLDDLLTGEPEPQKDDDPAFRALPVTVEGASAWKLLNGGQTLAAQLRHAHCGLRFHLTEPLRGQNTIHVIGYEGDSPPYAAFPLAKLGAATAPGVDPVWELAELPQPRPGWAFLEVVLTRGNRVVKRPLGSIRLVLNVAGADEPFVYEAAGEVDLPAQAYAAAEELLVIGETAGEQVFAEALEPPDAEFGDLVGVRGATVPAVVGNLDEPPSDEQPVQSPQHLALEAWCAGLLPPGNLLPSVRRRPDGEVVADVGPVARTVADVPGLQGGRWAAERHIIENPRTTTFAIDSSGNLTPAPHIEHALGDLEPAFNAYLDARCKFFAELAACSVPSVLAADLLRSTSVRDYLAAYEALLEAVEDGKAGQLGYDRLTLSDAIVTEEGDLLFAPTSPLAVAFHLRLQERVLQWLKQEPKPNFFAGDSALISIQHLVPYLRLHSAGGGWLESGYIVYPWRRYLPLAERAMQERHPWLSRYIARRIERFLDVHPTYADRRRTVRLAFLNPGSAAHVRDALLELVRNYARRSSRSALDNLPSFEIELLATAADDEAVLGSELDVFMGFAPEEGQPSDDALEVMARLSYTKGNAQDFLQDPKSFSHIAFVEDYFRPRTELVEWATSAHASSYYVGGLAADTERLAIREPAATRFLSAVWAGGVEDEQVVSLATRLGEIAASAAGVPVKRGIVRAADVLVPDSQLPELYERAVWVVHVDRNVGLELFAAQDDSSGAPYILDYTDQETPEPGVVDGVTATSQIGPYRALIAEVLGKAVGEPVSDEAASSLLRTLNLISGRWGLEMLRTPDNVLRGRLATALAAQAIEVSESLHHSDEEIVLVVALDELLRVSGGEGLPLRHGWAAKLGVKGGGSDDLLILTLPLTGGRPKLGGRIVEVKYRSGAGVSVDAAARQLKLTHQMLSAVLVDDNQPGRALQGRHLAKLIGRYVSRHVAYGLSSGSRRHPMAAATLARVGAGDYDLSLNFTRAGRTVCGDYVSVEPGLEDGSMAAHAASAEGVEIGRIRIGRPIISALLQRDWDAGAHAGNSFGPTPELTGNGAVAAGAAGIHDTMPPQAAIPVVSTEPEGASNALEDRSDPPPADLPREPTAVIERESDESEGVTQAGNRYEISKPELRRLAGRLDDVLMSFNLPLQPVQAIDAVSGPNTIRFRVRMARGGTIAQVEARERDIMRELGLEKPLMIGQEAEFVTLDVPRSDVVAVTFGDLRAELSGAGRRRGELPVLFGVDLAGRPRVEDLAQLPHLLVAGSTGAGKSVFLASLLASLARLPPSEVEILLVDVKGLDFAPFAALPHLRQAPISDAPEALSTLRQLYVDERANRQKVLAAAGAQSILDYYGRIGGRELSQMVIIIDEFSNLLGGDKATGTELEDIVQQYAEIMRSFGVYLVIATQRPSADIITGRIKANLPARCALRLPTHHDSMTVLGRRGAEQLLGRGDMLFYRDGTVDRLQAPLTTPADVLDGLQKT